MINIEYVPMCRKWYAGYRIMPHKWINAYGETEEEAIENLQKDGANFIDDINKELSEIRRKCGSWQRFNKEKEELQSKITRAIRELEMGGDQNPRSAKALEILRES